MDRNRSVGGSLDHHQFQNRRGAVRTVQSVRIFGQSSCQGKDGGLDLWNNDSDSNSGTVCAAHSMDRKEGVKMSIVIKQVTVEFKNHVRAVDQVDLTIPRGIYGC